MFIGELVIVITYVDDIRFWSADDLYDYEMRDMLQEEGIKLQEDKATIFLGVQQVYCISTGQLIMSQEGLILKIFNTFNVYTGKTMPKNMLYLTAPLTKYSDGAPW